MACPFVRSTVQVKVGNPDELEIELMCPCRYTSTVPGKYVNQKLLVGYPVYLRNTVFHTSHIQKLRNLDVLAKIATFDEFNREGNKFYHLEEFDKALDCYEHAYGLFKFIEGKYDGNLILEHFDVVCLEGKTEQDNDLRNKALITVLKNFVHTFAKLRNFQEAGEAIKEALELKPSDADLLVLQAKTRLCNIEYKNLPKVLKSLKKVVKLNQKYEFMLQKYNENLEARKKIVDKIYNSIADSYTKYKWDHHYERSPEKELEHKILEKMHEKYYEMLEFYLENNKTGNLCKIREEMKELQLVLFKMNLAFGIDSKDEKLVGLVSRSGAELVAGGLDSVKRVHISLIFNEGKFNDQLFAYCMEKCTEEERKKQKAVVKSGWGWRGFLVVLVVPVIVGGLLYKG